MTKDLINLLVFYLIASTLWEGITINLNGKSYSLEISSSKDKNE